MNSYKAYVWDDENVITAEIRFNSEQDLFKFRDALSERIKIKSNLGIIKAEGLFTQFNSCYILLDEKLVEQYSRNLEILKTKYPTPVMHPGFFHFLLKTKKYKQWDEDTRKRYAEENATWSAIYDIYSAMVATDFDYPYLWALSKISTKQELTSEIEQTADILHIGVEIIAKKPELFI